MKKIIIASIMSLGIASSHAGTVAVQHSRDIEANRDAASIELAVPVGGFTASIGFDRATSGVAQDRYSLGVARQLTSVGPLNLQARLGGHYLDNETGATGYALSAGAGVTMPLTKVIGVGLMVDYQWGQERVNAHDGTRVSAGVRFSF
jgi:hypothetical protein